jgi:hypothetical protein
VDFAPGTGEQLFARVYAFIYRDNDTPCEEKPGRTDDLTLKRIREWCRAVVD